MSQTSLKINIEIKSLNSSNGMRLSSWQVLTTCWNTVRIVWDKNLNKHHYISEKKHKCLCRSMQRRVLWETVGCRDSKRSLAHGPTKARQLTVWLTASSKFLSGGTFWNGYVNIIRKIHTDQKKTANVSELNLWACTLGTKPLVTMNIG